MRKTWTPVSRLRPFVGQPPTAGSPARPPQPISIPYRKRIVFAGAVILIGASLPQQTFTGTVVAREIQVVSQPPRIRPGSVIRTSRRIEPVVVVTPKPKEIRTAQGRNRVKNGQVIRTVNPRRTFTFVVDREFHVIPSHHERRRGKVFRFGPRRTNPAITGSLNNGLIRISNFTISLNVKREVDAGEISANASDVGGTVVTFNKDFKDVESITCTVDSTTEPFIVIYDFVDIPNPEEFTVYVFDTTGNRVSKVVSWKARGIV